MEKDVKNLKLSDFLRKESFHYFKHQILDFHFLSKNQLFIGTFGNHILSENSAI